MEMDYKSMFEQTFDTLSSIYSLQDEMGKCVKSVKENTEKATMASEHLFEMSLADQVMLMKAASLYFDLGAKLCDKYGFDKIEDKDENNE